jgi:hypothetical protein
MWNDVSYNDNKKDTVIIMSIIVDMAFCCDDNISDSVIMNVCMFIGLFVVMRYIDIVFSKDFILRRLTIICVFVNYHW